MAECAAEFMIELYAACTLTGLVGMMFGVIVGHRQGYQRGEMDAGIKRIQEETKKRLDQAKHTR
jgi:hypothetical protein